ncbi:MAG: MBG domain-containing protein, partial [Candidatus Faecousia sp.]|nr:MBG domain-containing protein [Candidatus Faecousia sp.]
TENGKTYGVTYTENAEVIDGYTVDADTKDVTVTTGENKIIFIYTKRSDLSYTVEYREGSKTGTQLKEAKTESGKTFGETYTETAAAIEGYTVDAETKSVTVGTGENKIVFIYTKRSDLSYTVEYREGSKTGTQLKEAKTESVKTFGETYTETAAAIEGYTVDAETKNVTVGTGENKIVFIYTKRTDLTYTVKYLWTDGMGSGTAIEGVQDKVVKNVTFGDVIVEGPIDITGYTPVETGKVESRMDAESKVITFLYYKNVTLTATSDSAVYNGTTQTLSGYTSSEAEAEFEGVTASGSGKDVGKYAVTFSGVSGREQKISKNGRYLLTGTVDGKLTITPATLTVKTKSDSKVYDGTALTAPGSISGLVNGETVTFTVTGSQTDVGSSTNTYSIVWGNVKATNYSLTEELGTLTVTAQSITPPVNPDDPNGYLGVQVDSPADHVYDGAEHKWAPTVTDKDGNALTENEDYTVSYSKTDFTNVTGDITVTIRGIGNYTGTVTRSYKITPREAVITVDNASKVFGQNDPAFTGTVSGLVNENDLGAVSYVRTNNAEAVGIYNDVLSAQYTENDNYNVEVNNGTFTITAKSIANLTVDAPTNHEYDGAEHKWAPTVTDKDGKPLTENEDYTVSYGKTDFTNVTGDITVTVQGIGNYTGTVTRSYKITPREAVITVNNGTKTAGRNDPAFTGTVTGLIGENDLGVVSYVRTNNAEAVGTYTDVLTALYTENANYDVRVINGTFVITAANNPNPNPPQPNPNPPQPNPNPPQPQPQPEPEPEVEPEAGPEVEPEVTPEEPQPAAPDAGPVEEIADEETPLAMGGAWALVNLILTVLTVLGSILLLIGYIGKKQKEREDENGNVILNAEGEAETDDIKKKGGWRLASIIPAVAAVIAFILTENMRLPMVLVDKWTLLMVIIALVQLLVAYFSKKKTQEPEQPEQMVANA